MANDYTPTGTFNDAIIKGADQALITVYKNMWTSANNSGDMAGMEAAHAGAEAIRAKYGYSGGADGSEYNPYGSYAPQTQSSSTYTQYGQQPQYTGTQISKAASAEKYINDMYAAQEAARLRVLKSAYETNVLALDAVGEKIPAQYQDARNYTAAQSEVQRTSFNEMAAGRGLNSGAGSQAYLAMGNALQGNLSGIYSAEADALSALSLQRSQLETAYRNDVSQAVAEGNLARAQALYNDYVRVDNSLTAASKAQADEDYRTWSANTKAYESYLSTLTKQAETLAAYGDFSGYIALGFTPAQVARMEEDFAITSNWANK